MLDTWGLGCVVSFGGASSIGEELPLANKISTACFSWTHAVPSWSRIVGGRSSQAPEIKWPCGRLPKPAGLQLPHFGTVPELPQANAKKTPTFSAGSLVILGRGPAVIELGSSLVVTNSSALCEVIPFARGHGDKHVLALWSY